MDLSTIELFSGVSPEVLAVVGRNSRLQNYPAGKVVFHRDDPSRQVLLVTKGKLMCAYTTINGQEIAFDSASSGALIGHLSAIDGLPRSLTVYGQRDATALVISQKDFWRLIDECVVFRRRILEMLSALTRKLTQRNLELSVLTVHQRVCALIWEIGRSQGLSFDPDADAGVGVGTDSDAGAGKHAHQLVMPTHQEIASFIGSNREGVSRALIDLKSMGIVETGRKTLRILSVEGLLSQLSEQAV